MNTTQKSDLLDEMIDELNRARTTKQAQIKYISEICEKSNNILLQIEASQRAKITQDDTTTNRYKYSKETVHALAKTVEMLERLVSEPVSFHTSGDFETYITTTKSKIDFFGSAVRKLLALNDTFNQISSEIHNDSDYFDLYSTDTGDANSSQ